MRLIMSIAILVVCAPLEAKAQCNSNGECKGGRVCLEGKCSIPQQTCSKDVDCPGEQICQTGVCGLTSTAVPATTALPPAFVGGSPNAPTRTVKKRLTWLWLAGAITLGAAYLTGIGVAAGTACESERGQAIGMMSIPVAGPFIQLATNECPLAGDYTAPLVVAGVFQILSATALVLGLSITHEVRVPSYALGDHPASPRLTLLPGAVGQDGFGFNLALTRF